MIVRRRPNLRRAFAARWCLGYVNIISLFRVPVGQRRKRTGWTCRQLGSPEYCQRRLVALAGLRAVVATFLAVARRAVACRAGARAAVPAAFTAASLVG